MALSAPLLDNSESARTRHTIELPLEFFFEPVHARTWPWDWS